jgi:hypothetical protein
MSIFLNEIPTKTFGTQDFQNIGYYRINELNTKAFGKGVYSHSIYIDLGERNESRHMDQGAELKKLFTIYAYGDDTLLYVRLDGMVENLNDNALIVCDMLIFSKEEELNLLYKESKFSYEVCKVDQRELPDIQELSSQNTFQLRLVAYGNWFYAGGGVLYIGHNEILNTSFALQHTLTHEKYKYSKNAIKEFCDIIHS